MNTRQRQRLQIERETVRLENQLGHEVLTAIVRLKKHDLDGMDVIDVDIDLFGEKLKASVAVQLGSFT